MLKIPHVVCILLLTTCFTATADQHENDKVFELRTYTPNEGRLDDLLSRFSDHTMSLFEKHGIENIGYWVTDNKLIYIVSHQSKSRAANSWKSFINDPKWKKVYAGSIAKGKLVAKIESVYMQSTDFSPLK